MSITLVQQPDQDPNPQGWMIAVVAAENVTQQQQYNSAVTAYQQACADWIAQNTANRSAGRPLTAPPAIPQLTVIYAANGNVLGQYLAAPDPALSAPALPAVVTPAASPANMLSVLAGDAQAATADAIQQTILSTVLAIKAKVGA